MTELLRAWPRPLFLFALVAAVVLAAETLVLASRAFPLHPRAFTLAVLFDLVVTLPAAWWLLVVRPGAASRRSTVRVVCLCIALCAALFGAGLRALAVPLELLLFIWAFRAARAALNSGGDSLERIRAACIGAFGDNVGSRAAAAELRILWSAVAPAKREQGFSHGHKAGWNAVAFALGLVTLAEAIPLDLWLRRFGTAPMAVGAAVHVYALLWLLGDARALRNRATRIDGAILRLKLGLRWEADIPVEAIESVEVGPPPADALQLKVLGATNLVLRLRSPVEVRGAIGISRRASALAVQVDDPQGLATVLRARS